MHRVVNNKLLRFLSDKHILKKDMFSNTHLSFDEAYSRFYDANYAQLCCPGRINEVNMDNASIRFLLAKFVEVILHGTEEEKQQVKRFFLGRANKKIYYILAKLIQRYLVLLLSQTHSTQTLYLSSILKA